MADKISNSQLKCTLGECPPPGSRYRHYKGGLVTVTGCAIDEETGEALVLYVEADQEIVFARKLSVFCGWVTHGGKAVQRFRQEGS